MDMKISLVPKRLKIKRNKSNNIEHIYDNVPAFQRGQIPADPGYNRVTEILMNIKS